MAPSNVRPRLHLLSPEQMNQVHRYSVEILEKTGIRVESDTARRIFSKSGAVRIKNDMIYISAELINHAIKTAPSDIEIFKRNGEPAFRLGKKQGNETYFGIGVTNIYYQDPESNRLELFTRKHMQHSTRMGDILDNYDMISTIGIPSDVPVELSDLYSTLDMYANTEKPLVLLISGENKINYVFEMLSSVHGNISARPFCIPYVNLITPLVLNASTTDKMISAINYDLPLMFSNYSMYGGTSPATPGGTLALLNAELMAGLVFSQLVREGSKIILGSLPAAFNMSTMGSYYTPYSYLLNLACAEMMHFYEIPHCGTSGSNNGRGADLPASENLWINHLSSCLGKVGCAPFVGGTFESMAFSPAMVVLSSHIIGEARKFAGGFTLDDECVNLDEIKKAGPGGNYFTSGQTLGLLQDKTYRTELWKTLNVEGWKRQNMPKAEDELIELTMQICKMPQKIPQDSLDITVRGEAFIKGMQK
ncbi:MAG: trimethylamine methyltransferase family protein [Bacteroidales bacterium]|nr:trimethylamine methyltransferase family protein [Bacteroidales bacterium]